MIRTQMIPTLLRRFVLSPWAMYEFASPGENYFVVHENEPIGEHIFLWTVNEFKRLNTERLTVRLGWRRQAVPDEILENTKQLTPTVRSAFLCSVFSSL